MNIDHFIHFYNIKTVLVDDDIQDFIQNRNQVKRIDVMSNEQLKPFYSLIIVSADNWKKYLGLYYRGLYIYIKGQHTSNYICYNKIDLCYDGVIYHNPYHSLMFDTSHLTVYEQTYIRDKPYRFLRCAQKLIKTLNMKCLVEIGSCRSPLNHELSIVNPACCNDSHSTFFWCETDCNVFTVDINPTCKKVLVDAYEDGKIEMSGDLNIHIQDGHDFLRDFDKHSDEKIDFLFLDAWDVIDDPHATFLKDDYAQKHLAAYTLAKPHLAENCFILIDDTDVSSGGKGRILVPVLKEEGWIILFQARQTLLYKGNIDRLHALP